MRLGGALLTLHAVFLLVRNVGYGIGDDVFYALCLGLDLFTFAFSRLPVREERDGAAVACWAIRLLQPLPDHSLVT